MKRYVVINPEEVVEFGFSNIRGRFHAGKYEVEDAIAKLIYEPCSLAQKGEAADITGAFNYEGFPCKDGVLTFKPERLIKYFEVVKEEGETIYLRFNSKYEEGDEILSPRISAWAKLIG